MIQVCYVFPKHQFALIMHCDFVFLDFCNSKVQMCKEEKLISALVYIKIIRDRCGSFGVILSKDNYLQLSITVIGSFVITCNYRG